MIAYPCNPNLRRLRQRSLSLGSRLPQESGDGTFGQCCMRSIFVNVRKHLTVSLNFSGCLSGHCKTFLLVCFKYVQYLLLSRKVKSLSPLFFPFQTKSDSLTQASFKLAVLPRPTECRIQSVPRVWNPSLQKVPVTLVLLVHVCPTLSPPLFVRQFIPGWPSTQHQPASPAFSAGIPGMYQHF